MVDAALATLRAATSDAAVAVRAEYEAMKAVAKDRVNPQADTEHDKLRIDAICAQRELLATLRRRGNLGRCVPSAEGRARLGRAACVDDRDGSGDILMGEFEVPVELEEFWHEGKMPGLLGTEEKFVGSRPRTTPDGLTTGGDERTRLFIQSDAKHLFELMQGQMPDGNKGIIKAG